jgi:RNA polymerase-binding transcription factor DksA
MKNEQVKLTAEQLKLLRALIENQIVTLSRVVNKHIDAQRNQEHVVVSDDCSPEFIVREQDAAMTTVRYGRLRDLNAACKRIEQKVFGLCASCEEPIGFPRLKAVPTAHYCINCANLPDIATLQYR